LNSFVALQSPKEDGFLTILKIKPNPVVLEMAKLKGIM